MQKLKELFIKYKEEILYLFFGGCTTLVNIVAYFLFARILQFDTVASNVLAWILSVLFAYITNRIWVFESKEKTFGGVMSEMLKFVGCRVATGLMDTAIMYIFVDLLSFNDMVVKVLSNILVIILNYVASKLFIFKAKK